ncbi:Uncharacterised protein [Nocardia cyriacigeorgica]|uniref:Uncharacterized protein n=2 Tax=Nocardia cyriacigeorgica TaxID=135487 RepID=A0A4U8W6W1_9NOCA|nr:Uncharacterised protein [Nocardia cyriacigeorgica]
MSVVRRFWIEFERGHESALWWIGSYAGVTGYDERDCLAMVADLLTDGAQLPPVRRITPDIVVDENLPVNVRALGVPVWPGVWYPPMNLKTGPDLTRQSRRNTAWPPGR